MKNFAVLQLAGCAGCEVSLLNADEWVGEYRLAYMPLNAEDTAVPCTPRDGEGYGLVEAPRGPLLHRYVISNGLIADAEFVNPTVHNIKSIERALVVAARRHINGERIDMELERAVGRVV